MKKSIVSLLLVFVVILQMFMPVSAAQFETRSSDKFTYIYDKNGNAESVYIGDKLYSHYNYTDDYLVSSIEFANEQSIAYDYDSNHRVTNLYYDDVKVIDYDYSNYGEVGVERDYISDRITSTDDSYTVSNMTTGKELFRIDEVAQNNFVYSMDSDIVSRNTTVDNSTQTELEYEVEDKNCIISNHYDLLGRIINKKVEYDALSITSDYEYINDVGDYVQSQKTHIFGKSIDYTHVWEYEYDKNGNITNRIFKEDNIPVKSDSFKYDNNGELILIRDSNQIDTEMKYDKFGNIIKVTEYKDDAITGDITYEYSDESWEDKLTGYNDSQIIYDAVGNPLIYNDKIYQWTAGRRLESLNIADDTRILYYYDELGHRTKKVIINENSNIEYEYFWLGDTLIAMTIEGLNENIIDTVFFLYDFDGNIYGFVKNGIDVYLYETSTTGNVIAIYNENGIVANYDYDDFGNITYSCEKDTMIKYYNPFYYRSYFYDIESKMYYLLSRYYVPEWGRFLNGDAYFSTGVGCFDTNMFTYCDNNYVNFSDPYGYWAKEDHKNWSKTLASEAGFTSSIATAIGEGSYSVDIDMSTNPLRAPIKWKYNQRYHFDRRNYCNNISGGEDTRVYYANLYIDDALAKKASGDSLNAAKLIGKALHFLQDVSSHGNVGINSSIASHGSGFDDPKYEWKNDSRNSVYKVNSNYQYENGPKGYSSRYAEVMLTTSLLIILYKTSK